MPEITVLGKYHVCKDWLPSASKENQNLVVECVCGRVYFCKWYDHDPHFSSWVEYPFNLVDTLAGHDIKWLDEVTPS